MGILIMLLIAVALPLLLFVYKLMKLSHKIASKYIKNKFLAWTTACIPLVLFIIGACIDFINTYTVTAYLMLIVALTKLVFYIIKKIFKKSFNEYTSTIIGVIITAILMSFAYYSAYHVEETYYTVHTLKNINTPQFRVVQIADSHIGNTLHGKDFEKYVKQINELKPDIVAITGDFVDDDTVYADMVEATRELGKLKTKYGIYYVYGNHDKGYGNYRDFQDKELREELEKNNIVILEDEYINLTNEIALVGRQDKSMRSRMSIQDLTSELDNKKYIIVLDHQPNDYENEKEAGVDLVLSGHTHGGQVFPIGPLSVWFGANDSYYGLEKRDNTTFIVTSGISDWAVKFKLGTKSEYVVIDVKE